MRILVLSRNTKWSVFIGIYGLTEFSKVRMKWIVAHSRHISEKSDERRAAFAAKSASAASGTALYRSKANVRRHASRRAHLVSMAKKVFLMVGGLAVQKYGMALEKNQEVLSLLADIMIQISLLKGAASYAKAD